MPTVGIKRDLLFEALGREYSKLKFDKDNHYIITIM